jgi:hypothetical protein
VLPTHDIVKGHVSTSEEVPMHSLGYELPRTPSPRRSATFVSKTTQAVE